MALRKELTPALALEVGRIVEALPDCLTERRPPKIEERFR